MAPAREDLVDPPVDLAGIGMLVHHLRWRQPGGLGRLAEMILRGGPEKSPQPHRHKSRPRLLRRGGFGTDFMVRAIELDMPDNARGIDECVEHGADVRS